MTLNAKIIVSIVFLCDFVVRHTFQERIAPKSIDVDQENLHVKFSTLNVVFTSSNFGPLRSRKPPYGNVPLKCALLAAQAVADARDRLRCLATVDAKNARIGEITWSSGAGQMPPGYSITWYNIIAEQLNQSQTCFNRVVGAIMMLGLL